jgi:hypothetical protein
LIEKPVKINYLLMILYPKVFCANKKDGKGKDLKIPAKKSLLTKIRPKIPLSGHFPALPACLFWSNEMAGFRKRLPEFYPPGTNRDTGNTWPYRASDFFARNDFEKTCYRPGAA